VARAGLTEHRATVTGTGSAVTQAAAAAAGWRLPRLRLPRRPPPRRRRGCGHRGRHRAVTATVGVRHWQLEGSGLFRAEHGPVGA